MRYIIRGMSERQSCIDYLRSRLPDADYIIDVKDAMAAFMVAMLKTGNDPAVHMEEDVILTKDFRQKLEAVISKYPYNVIQFFSMRKADLEIGSRWEPVNSWN